jgi:Amt family ammonium transporter
MPRWAGDSRRWILRVGPWCTLRREFQRWCAPCIWGSAWDNRRSRWPPHSVALSFIGACPLWVGWFGFNAGSALAAGSLATSAFVATHFAAAAATGGWAGAEWIRNGKPSVLGGISGAVAGLVAITPAAGFVKPMAALLIGLIAGVFCYGMVAKVKAKFGYDDSLDAFGVHGAGRTLGALLTGVFALSAVNPMLKDAQGNTLASGLIEGNAHQMLNQCVGVLIAWALAIVGTLAILKRVDLTRGLRVTEEEEVQGPGSLPAQEKRDIIGRRRLRFAGR